MSFVNYKEVLKTFFPKGFVWEIGPGNFDKILDAMAKELCRVDDRIEQLLKESKPGTAVELIEEWEKHVGLPLKCFDSIAETIGQRQLDVVAAWISTGGQSPQYYIDIALAAGYVITIERFMKPFVAGFFAGDFLSGDSAAFTWEVDATLATIDEFGNLRLECLMNTFKPAHTTVIFKYSVDFFHAGSFAGDFLARIVPN